MPTIVCGINHKTAPIALREKAVFLPEKIALYLNDLLGVEGIHEAVLLSTCNRSELYCEAEDARRVVDWFCRQHQLPIECLEEVIYCYQGDEAVQHLMKVASGLDSMIVGESQILGQVKNAYSESCAVGAIGSSFNRLFQQVFAMAKTIRTTTDIGACPVSIASNAVNFIKEQCHLPFKDASILLIGAGDTIQLVLRYLKVHTPKQITVINRRFEQAESLALSYGINAAPFSSLKEAIHEADVIMTATASPQPLVTKAVLESRSKPLYCMDLAVPRDIDPDVSTVSQVSLYSIDDLRHQIQKNLRGREHAAEKAKEMIKQKSAEFMAWQQSSDQVSQAIRVYRKQIEDLCSSELSKSLRQLDRGLDPRVVLNEFAHALTNKILHAPSVQLRRAGFDGRFEMLQWAKQLFALQELDSEIT